MSNTKNFVPALGRSEWTGGYDHMIAIMTRERHWRAALMTLVAPQPGDRIVDVGCGTGTLATMLKAACLDAEIIGVDPDEEVLGLARGKAAKAGVEVKWRRGFGDELPEVLSGELASKVVSSLVLHQCALPTKAAILGSMFAVLRPGGQLHIADYGLQRSMLMRLLFRQVQALDGFEITQPNADGVLPTLIAQAGFSQVEEVRVIPTPTGTISLYRAEKPC